MPLLKRTPFSLLEPPNDLDPNEKVFKVECTKEIFRDYQEYQRRVDLYCQNVWTCKLSGKSKLTYEEALVCEEQAAAKAQQLPKELIAPVLRMIQHSTLSLTDLVEKVFSSLVLDLSEGLELHAKKDGSEAACKILEVISSGGTKSYEVGWIGKGNEFISTSVVKADDLILKKAPASRNVLKFYIRESTTGTSPWTLHPDLAKKYGIPTEVPVDVMNGEGLNKGRKRFVNEDASKKLENDQLVEPPVDDLLLVKPADEPILSNRPPLSKDFRVPVDSVGDLLMVWDFCLSFGRLLCLSPFSLSDLENAICTKESNLVLVVEIHSALLRLLIKDESEYFTILQNKKKKLKVTFAKWSQYLCNFLEMISKEEFCGEVSTIRRGSYGLLETRLKLKILRELIDKAITTSSVREKIREQINQKGALGAARKADARNNRQEKLNMEGVAESGRNHTDNTLDGNKLPKGQHRGEEREDLNFLRRHPETEMEQQSIQPSPLGKDRFYNRYWFFMCEGRLFVETADSREWGYYSTKEELDALLGSFNTKGIRERALKHQLDKFYDKISNALESRSKNVQPKMLLEDLGVRRSSRLHAAQQKEDMSFLEYVNKWKQN